MNEAWEWARTSPVVPALTTLVGYLLGRRIRDLTRGNPLAQPALIAIVVVAVVNAVLGIDYADYLTRVDLITFWLGPATVALAVPLHLQAHRLRGFVVPMLTAIVVGAVTSVTSVVVIARALGADDTLQRTLAPKAATTPVAIALSDHLGGIPALSAVFAIIIGIVGAIAAPAVLTWIRVTDPRSRGLAIGAVSHGIGTARALHEDPTEGAFSGLAMGLTAFATSIVVSLLAPLLF